MMRGIRVSPAWSRLYRPIIAAKTSHLQPQLCRGVVYRSQDTTVTPRGHPTTTHWVEERTRPFGDKVALIDVNTDHAVTYNELFRRAFGFARGLRERGFRQGDRYMMFSPNTIDSAVAILGVMAVGGIFTGINPGYTKGEVQRSLELVTPSVFHTVPALAETLGDMKQMSPHLKTCLTSGGSLPGTTTFDDVISHDCSPVAPSDNFDPARDTSLILFSSGTTGLPKGVQVSSHNLMASVISSMSPGNWIATCDDVAFSIFPFYHVAGVTVALLAYLVTGSTTLTMSAFDFELYLKSIEKYQITQLLIPPTVGRQLVSNPITANYDLSSLKGVLIGAAPVRENLIRQLTQKLGAKVDIAYGMSETAGITHCTLGRDCPLASVGRVIPGVECKIISLEDGRELSQGEEGEVLVRGDVIMLGYYGNQRATDESLDKDGWYYTGDVGYCDENENLFIVDRKKELIKYKAFQVAPAELEDLLLRHDAVADAGVIGIPHEEEELARAYVVRQPGSDVTADELVKYVADNTAHFKHLRGGVRFIEEMPKLPSGKILRRVLKDFAKTESESQAGNGK